MKTLINLGLIGLVIMFIFDRDTYLRLEAPLVHVIHFVLMGYLIWIIMSDLFKGLRRTLTEKFGFAFKRMKRRFSRFKQKAIR